jgi:hypothetical protein
MDGNKEGRVDLVGDRVRSSSGMNISVERVMTTSCAGPPVFSLPASAHLEDYVLFLVPLRQWRRVVTSMPRVNTILRIFRLEHRSRTGFLCRLLREHPLAVRRKRPDALTRLDISALLSPLHQ